MDFRTRFHELLSMLREEPNGTALRDLAEELRDARNVHGDSLLHILAAEGDGRAVKTLLDLGCDVNVQNNFGSTSIVCPAGQEDFETMKLLLDAGADLNIKDSTDSTMFDNLRLVKKLGVVEWIVKFQAGQQG